MDLKVVNASYKAWNVVGQPFSGHMLAVSWRFIKPQAWLKRASYGKWMKQWRWGWVRAQGVYWWRWLVERMLQRERLPHCLTRMPPFPASTSATIEHISIIYNNSSPISQSAVRARFKQFYWPLKTVHAVKMPDARRRKCLRSDSKTGQPLEFDDVRVQVSEKCSLTVNKWLKLVRIRWHLWCHPHWYFTKTSEYLLFSQTVSQNRRVFFYLKI